MAKVPKEQWCSKHQRKYIKAICPQCADEQQLEQASLSQKPNQNAIPSMPPIIKETYQLIQCPDCHERSLFHSDKTGERKCFNRKCPTNSLSIKLTEGLTHP